MDVLGAHEIRESLRPALPGGVGDAEACVLMAKICVSHHDDNLHSHCWRHQPSTHPPTPPTTATFSPSQALGDPHARPPSAHRHQDGDAGRCRRHWLELTDLDGGRCDGPRQVLPIDHGDHLAGLAWNARICVTLACRTGDDFLGGSDGPGTDRDPDKLSWHCIANCSIPFSPGHLDYVPEHSASSASGRCSDSSEALPGQL